MVEPHEGPAGLVHGRAYALALLVTVEDRELPGHDRTLVLDELDPVLVQLEPLVEPHSRIVRDFRRVSPEPMGPPFLVVASLEDDRDLRELLAEPADELPRLLQLASEVPLPRVFGEPRDRVEVRRVSVQHQGRELLPLEMLHGRRQGDLGVVGDVDVRQDAD